MPGRSHGAWALAKRSVTQQTVATAAGVSRIAVQKWIAGSAKPAPPMRAKLHELYGIAPHWWDETFDPVAHGGGAVASDAPAVAALTTAASPPAAKGAGARAASLTPPSTPSTYTAPEIGRGVFGIADAIESDLRDTITEGRNDAMRTPMERASVLVKCADGLERLAKIRGQLDLSTKLIKVPAYKEMLAALGRGLRGAPEVAARVARELRAVEIRHLGFGESPEDVPEGEGFFEERER